jgi:hypothetical protein
MHTTKKSDIVSFYLGKSRFHFQLKPFFLLHETHKMGSIP